MFEEDEATVMVPTFGPGYFFADRYRIDALLGSGAMGRVYAATELHSSRRVALKILHRERLGERETVERFRREAEVLASIGHPCIVEVYTFHHTSDGTPYLAMELLEGVTLKTRLHNAGRFEDPRDFQEVLDGICGALSAAHARGVVHRDLKPDNVFLLATGEPRSKLVDFGLSRLAAPKMSLTQSGMILGTPRYMAPEQIRDASSAGPAGDIYSVGILMFESLTGQSPYPAQDYGQLLGCVIEGRTTPLEQVRPDLPRGIGDLIRRAMDKDPAKRFASSGELADAYGGAIGSPSRRRQLAHKKPDPAPRQRRSTLGQSSLVSSKGSTLAFDVSAFDRLPDVHEVAPALAGAQGARSMPDTASSMPGAYPSGGNTAPMQGFTSAPAPMAAPSPAAPSTKGDTLFLPSLHDQPVAPTPQPLPPQPSFSSQMGPAPPLQHAPAPGFARSIAPPPAPAKKSRRGLVLFLVAMVIVIVLSAAGGFALRAHMKGDLSLPFVGTRSAS